MSVDFDRVKEIFLAAVEQKSADAREAYLDRACGDDPALRSQVVILLAAHAGASGAHGRDVAMPATTQPTVAHTEAVGPVAEAAEQMGRAGSKTDPGSPSGRDEATIDTASPHEPQLAPQAALVEGPGLRVGPYRLLQPIGEGGMGAVFMAEQERPVRRRVALKVIKPGMDSAQVLARFEAERQALALMEHPNIARVFDAGTTDSGRPFFVMELVKGISITQYCDEARLSPRERLDLFVPVCQAIQHAHQKGIIHRDIKPSNVLVTEIDGKPVPKVIDFGIAKATDQRLTERTLFTQFGSIVGTLEYMSPEQASLSGVDVDTRADVYSLGVLLYELLTGTTPLERHRLREAGYAEILRRIQEEEPPKPSTRLSGSGDGLASIAARRATEPARLTRLVRGDLDWIVMRSLEKGRNRRYETASGFARDIRRYLDGDPVEAGPPSLRYRAGKYARKHRAAFAIAGVFVLLLVTASVVSTALMLRARAAERLAEARLHDLGLAHEETTKALIETRKAQSRASLEADKVGAINKFLTQDLLTQAEPANNAAEDHVDLLTVLDRAAAKVGERFEGQPEIEDALRRTIAETYHGLASMDKAERQWRAVLESARRRLGPESTQALAALAQIAHILSHREPGNAEALQMARMASDGLVRAVGPDHPESNTAREFLAQIEFSVGRATEAIALLKESLKWRQAMQGSDQPHTLAVASNLARYYREVGRPAEAIALLEPALKQIEATQGPNHPNTLSGRRTLAQAYLFSGRLDEAVALDEETLRRSVARFGPNHLDTLEVRDNLGEAYRIAGRVAEAIALHEGTLKQRQAMHGPNNPHTLSTANSLAGAYFSAGRIADALPIFESVLKLTEAKLGPDHPHTLISRANLAAAYLEAGRVAEAIALNESSVKIKEMKLGPDHPDTLIGRSNLAQAYLAAGRIAQAIAVHEANLRHMSPKLGPDDPRTLISRGNLASAYLAADRVAEATRLLEATVKAMEAKLGPDHHATRKNRAELATAYLAAGRAADAEPLLVDTLKQARARLGATDPRTADALARLGTCLLRQRKWPEAEPSLRESLAIRQGAQPDAWTTFNTESLLGGALLGQRKFKDAESLLREGYEGMKARTDKIPPSGRIRLGEALDRLIEFAEATGRADEGRMWRKEKAKQPAGGAAPKQ